MLDRMLGWFGLESDPSTMRPYLLTRIVLRTVGDALLIFAPFSLLVACALLTGGCAEAVWMGANLATDAVLWCAKECPRPASPPSVDPAPSADRVAP
jgi:hypothetical protein